MSDRVLIHAIWASAIMYAVALVCLSVVVMHRPAAESAEAVAAKAIALFGPLVTLLSAVVFRRRDNGPGAKEKS